MHKFKKIYYICELNYKNENGKWTMVDPIFSISEEYRYGFKTSKDAIKAISEIKCRILEENVDSSLKLDHDGESLLIFKNETEEKRFYVTWINAVVKSKRSEK